MALFFDILFYIFLAIAVIYGIIVSAYTHRLSFETDKRLSFGKWLKQSFGDTSEYTPRELEMLKTRDSFERAMLFFLALAMLCALIRFFIEPW